MHMTETITNIKADFLDKMPVYAKATARPTEAKMNENIITRSSNMNTDPSSLGPQSRKFVRGKP